MLPFDVSDENKVIKIPTVILHSIASGLQYYSKVLPAGSAFVNSLFQSMQTKMVHSTLSVKCKRDIAWWKFIIVEVLRDTKSFGRSLHSLRLNLRPGFLFVTDASGGVGGGGWLVNLSKKVKGQHMGISSRHVHLLPFTSVLTFLATKDNLEQARLVGVDSSHHWDVNGDACAGSVSEFETPPLTACNNRLSRGHSVTSSGFRNCAEETASNNTGEDKRPTSVDSVVSKFYDKELVGKQELVSVLAVTSLDVAYFENEPTIRNKLDSCNDEPSDPRGNIQKTCQLNSFNRYFDMPICAPLSDQTTLVRMGFIRWSAKEMYLIKEYNISINVLEYFILIYYMMKWESAFHRGDIIEARSDNTAAVSWMNKNRGGKSSPPSEILAKLFCLYSYKMI